MRLSRRAAFWSVLEESSGCHSAARQRLKPFRIPSPFDSDVRGGTFDVTEIFECKSNVSGSEVFFKAMQLGCPGTIHGFLCKHPSESDLSRCRPFLQTHASLILRESEWAVNINCNPRPRNAGASRSRQSSTFLARLFAFLQIRGRRGSRKLVAGASAASRTSHKYAALDERLDVAQGRVLRRFREASLRS